MGDGCLCAGEEVERTVAGEEMGRTPPEEPAVDRDAPGREGGRTVEGSREEKRGPDWGRRPPARCPWMCCRR